MISCFRGLAALLALNLMAPGIAVAAGPQLHFVDPTAGEVTVHVQPASRAPSSATLSTSGPGVALLERDETGQWARVVGQGAEGWVEADRLRLAFGQGPEVMRVTGVEVGDVLNVRAGPSADTEVLGDVGGDGSLVEVLEAGPDARWGRIILGERNGWVSLRYLVPASVPRLAGSPVAIGMQCGGTEPFWGLWILSETTARFDTPEYGEDVPIVSAGRAGGRISYPAYVETGEGEGRRWLIVRPAVCNDGMSDRTYGWSADLVGQGALLTGCCQSVSNP